MITRLMAALLLAGAAQPAVCASDGGFDVLSGIMDSTKNEINARQAVEASKQDFQKSQHVKRYRDGYWQFFQASSAAKAGEYCTAMFMREGMGVALLGPGGSYKGALMMFFRTHENDGFPSAAKPTKIAVTLQQGNGAPVTTRAFNYTMGSWETPVIVFAVPTIDAALAGMEDKLAFRLQHEGKALLNVQWHSGTTARDELRKCLAGRSFNRQSP